MLKTKSPRIETLADTKLVGKKMVMSFSNNTTKELWQSFIPQKTKIQNAIGNELYSVEVYPSQNFLKEFDPSNSFEKWAAVRVSNFDFVPEGLEPLVIPKGLYAVFVYQGKASQAASAYQYIFNTWLPNSGYTLDNRPHFALMGEKYKNESTDSEEELWIPISRVY